MYKVVINYRLDGSDELRYITLTGVYLTAGVLEWISRFPNLVYLYVDKLDKKSE